MGYRYRILHKTVIIWAAGRSIILLMVSIIALACVSCGPRMTDQISIQPYERKMPDIPAGTVPVTGRIETNTLQQSKSAVNPLQNTPDNLKRGKIYYRYYCLMCHGQKGDGNGPVGESYVPKPADLTSSAVTGLTDGQLYIRMLTGTGHYPVMEETVLPEHRWELVLYVRSLSKGNSVSGGM